MHRQSPIRIFPDSALPLDHTVQPFFDYKTTVCEVKGGNKIFPLEPATVRFGHKLYDLQHFHYHQPSEHVLANGPACDAECHLVHVERGNANNLLVCGVFLNKDAPHGAAHAAVLQGASTGQVTVDLQQLVPADSRFFTYAGSLTTPPYTENVRWIVFETPLGLAGSDFPFQDARPCQTCTSGIVFAGKH